METHSFIGSGFILYENEHFNLVLICRIVRVDKYTAIRHLN